MWFGLVQSKVLVNSVLTLGVQRIVVIAPALDLPRDDALVFLAWYVVHTPGANTISTLYPLRRGPTLTSLLVNVNQNVTTSGGGVVAHSGCYFDRPGRAGGVQYSLAVADTNASTNSTIQDACLLAFVL